MQSKTHFPNIKETFLLQYGNRQTHHCGEKQMQLNRIGLVL